MNFYEQFGYGFVPVPSWLHALIERKEIPQDIATLCFLCCRPGGSEYPMDQWYEPRVHINTGDIKRTKIFDSGHEPYVMVRLNEMGMLRADEDGMLTLQPPSEHRERIGFVYLIESVDGQYKIGYTSSDPKKRLSSLQTASPSPLSIRSVMSGTMEDERFIQKQLADYGFHIKGEWFSGGWWVKEWDSCSFNHPDASALPPDLYSRLLEIDPAKHEMVHGKPPFDRKNKWWEALD